MQLVVGSSAYSMGAEELESVLSLVAPKSKGIYALRKGGTVMLVNEPYSPQKVLEYEADGWNVSYRAEAHS